MRELSQTVIGARRVAERAGRVVGRARQAAPLLLLLLNGCSSDRPYYAGPPQGQPHRPPAPAAKPVIADAGGPPDPLIGETGQTSANPLMGNDPLLGNDSLLGRTHPMKHTHWLRGRLHDARVTVLLNGVWYGTFSGAIDRDINRGLRQGANTVKFVYQPRSASSAGALEIVESEHHPPITLVTFRSQTASEAAGRTAGSPQALGGGRTAAASLKPVAQTFPLIAN